MQDQIASGIVRKIQSRFLEISHVGDRVLFSCDRSIAEKIGLRLREKEVRWMVKSRLGRLGAVSPGSFPHSFLMANEVLSCGWIKNVLIELDQNLDAIAHRPLTHRMVEQLLGITARERLRWTKDGRLPKSGHASFQKGRTILIATHPVDKISDLLARPEIVAAWREDDKKQEE